MRLELEPGSYINTGLILQARIVKMSDRYYIQVKPPIGEWCQLPTLYSGSKEVERVLDKITQDW